MTYGYRTSFTAAAQADREETIVDGRFSSSGDIALSDGSVTQGAIYFADDKNTGIYSPSNDQIAFTTAGTAALTIANDNATFAGQLTIPSKASTYEGITLSTPNGDGSGEFHIGVHEAGTSNGRSIVFKRGGADGCDTESVRIGNDGTTTFSGVIKPNDNGQRDLGGGSNKWHTVHTRFVKIGASTGDGIQFNAYDEDTTDGNNISSNTLDDYEEGTWTPQFKLGAYWGYGTRTGHYVKIGNTVWVNFQLVWTSRSVGGTVPSGTEIKVDNLPFEVNHTDARWAGSLGYVDGIDSGVQLHINMVDEYDNIDILKKGAAGGDNAPVPVKNSDLYDTGEIVGSISYTVA